MEAVEPPLRLGQHVVCIRRYVVGRAQQRVGHVGRATLGVEFEQQRAMRGQMGRALHFQRQLRYVMGTAALFQMTSFAQLVDHGNGVNCLAAAVQGLHGAKHVPVGGTIEHLGVAA